jgi:hypothetical protein
MTNQHSITPPRELLDKWNNLPLSTQEIFVIVAQWGADQELEACVDFVQYEADWNTAEKLRAARRPKPPSLKEQALQALRQVGNCEEIDNVTFETIRRALEALPE